MSFAFKPEDKWNAGGGLLQKGNHICEVLEITAGDLTSSGQYPMIKVRTGNDDGSIYDNIVISSEATFGKFTALVLAAGIPESEYPQPGVDFDADNGRVSQQYADKLLGRTVATIVRDAPDNRPDHMGEFRPEVQGYRPPNTVSDDAPADTRGLPAAGTQANAKGKKGKEDKIPF